MLRVTADSNIYISALNFGGTPDQLLELARQGKIKLYITDAILEECGRVLRDKFGWTPEAVELAQARIGDFTEKVTPQEAVNVITADPTDNRILECAAEGKCDYLVTGDKHLLSLQQFGTVRIVKPAEFVKREFSRSRQ